MSFNIVDLVKDQIGDQLLGQMGNLLGDEGSKAGGAVDSIIPSLLGGLTGSAKTSQGADSLFNAVQDQDDSLLDNIGSMLGGGQSSSFIENGNSVLGSLLGSGAIGKLVGAISGFSGVSKGGTSSLLGMLAPIVIGVLKRKVLGDGLNAGSLAGLLGGQESNIAAAMPQGFGDQLNASGFLSSLPGAGLAAGAAGVVANAAGGIGDAASNVVGGVSDAAGNVVGGVSDAAGNVVGGVSNAASNVAGGVTNVAGNVADGVGNAAENVRDGASNAAGAVADGAKQGGSLFRWLLPLIVLALLGWLAFKFLLGGNADDVASNAASTVSDSAGEVKDAASNAASTATDAATDATAKVGDAVSDMADISSDAVGEKLTGIFGGATDALSGITDASSATAALPALGDIGTNLSEVSGMMEKLPEAARGPVASIAQQGMGKLQPLIDKVMGLPGVGAILEPVLGPIMESLQSFGG